MFRFFKKQNYETLKHRNSYDNSIIESITTTVGFKFIRSICYDDLETSNNMELLIIMVNKFNFEIEDKCLIYTFNDNYICSKYLLKFIPNIKIFFNYEEKISKYMIKNHKNIFSSMDNNKVWKDVLLSDWSNRNKNYFFKLFIPITGKPVLSVYDFKDIERKQIRYIAVNLKPDKFCMQMFKIYHGIFNLYTLKTCFNKTCFNKPPDKLIISNLSKIDDLSVLSYILGKI